MKYVSILCALALAGCSKAQVQQTLQPLESAGCAVESTISSALGASTVSNCGGTDAVACGAAYQTMFGNINFCAMAIPAPVAASFAKAVAAGEIKADDVPVWKTLGDIPASALQSAAIKSAVMKLGLIGSIACPVAEQGAIALLSGAIPAPCGCTKPLSAGSLGPSFILVCEAAMAPLP